MKNYKILLDELNENLKISPKDFFHNLGVLHDCEIKDLFYAKEESLLKIYLDDVYSGFLDLPEYKDLKNVYLNFVIESFIEINIDSFNDNKLRIYDIEFKGKTIFLNFSPSGNINLDYKMIFLSFD